MTKANAVHHRHAHAPIVRDEPVALPKPIQITLMTDAEVGTLLSALYQLANKAHRDGDDQLFQIVGTMVMRWSEETDNADIDDLGRAMEAADGETMPMTDNEDTAIS